MRLVWVVFSVICMIGLIGCGADGPPMPPKTEDVK